MSPSPDSLRHQHAYLAPMDTAEYSEPARDGYATGMSLVNTLTMQAPGTEYAFWVGFLTEAVTETTISDADVAAMHQATHALAADLHHIGIRPAAASTGNTEDALRASQAGHTLARELKTSCRQRNLHDATEQRMFNGSFLRALARSADMEPSQAEDLHASRQLVGDIARFSAAFDRTAGVSTLATAALTLYSDDLKNLRPRPTYRGEYRPIDSLKLEQMPPELVGFIQEQREKRPDQPYALNERVLYLPATDPAFCVRAGEALRQAATDIRDRYGQGPKFHISDFHVGAIYIADIADTPTNRSGNTARKTAQPAIAFYVRGGTRNGFISDIVARANEILHEKGDQLLIPYR